MPLLLLLASNIATHFSFFGYPASVVFDEVYYGNFVSLYLHGSYFFDQHPPLVKLLLTLIGYIIGEGHYAINWSEIGNSLPSIVLWMRLLPTIAGIALPLVIYALCYRLKLGKTASITVATLLTLENSLVVQSRFILPDVILLLVGFSSLLLYFKYRQSVLRYRYWLLIGSAVLAASALSIKWTGLTFLFLILLLEIQRLFDRRNIVLFAKRYAAHFIIYTGMAAILYISLFAIHFSLLPNTGPGDAFMSQRFQSSLVGNQFAKDTNLQPESFPTKFVELNTVMYDTNKYMTATHSYSSKWYTWPFMIRPIFYWQGSSTVDTLGVSRQPYIYLLGNPLVYWLGTASVLFLIIILIYKVLRRGLSQPWLPRDTMALFLVIAYLVNLLPFIFIGRVMFLYHYEVALIFSIIATGFVLQMLSGRKQIIAASALIIAALALFIFFAPLTYGTPITDSQLQARMWLPTWR